jgi:hypothetical protein
VTTIFWSGALHVTRIDPSTVLNLTILTVEVSTMFIGVTPSPDAIPVTVVKQSSKDIDLEVDCTPEDDAAPCLE